MTIREFRELARIGERGRDGFHTVPEYPNAPRIIFSGHESRIGVFSLTIGEFEAL